MNWDYALQYDSSGLTEPYLHEPFIEPAKRILIEAIENWLEREGERREEEGRRIRAHIFFGDISL